MDIINLFNSEVKINYLNQFENTDTREVYNRIFKRSGEMEHELGKDLYDFNEVEIEQFLGKVLRPKTKESARTYCNVLSNYIQWAIDNPDDSQCGNTDNVMRHRQEYFYNFVQNLKLYINLDEKMAFINELENRQDSVIIDALWEGIQGSKLNELINLRIKDVDSSEMKITLRNDNGDIVRQLDFSDDEDATIITTAILANKEHTYYKMDGTFDYSDVPDALYFANSEYVLKSAPTNSKDNVSGGEKVSHYTAYNRLEMIRRLEKFEEYTDALVSKNIVRSGMIYMALKLYERDHELGRSQIGEICARYNMNYKWSLRDFLNMNTLEDMYPERVANVTKK